MTTVDVIILSLANTPTLREVTERCLETLLSSEPGHPEISFRIIVVESHPAAPPYSGENVETIYPKTPFGYHAYMNLGIGMTCSPYICLCNNDLVFHPGWVSSLLAAFDSDKHLYSASPICTLHHPTVGINPNTGKYYGYGIRKEVAGWCLFFRRDMLKITGPLDERFRFWFADNDYAMTLEKHGLRHALVTDAIVDHVESRTLRSRSSLDQLLLTKRAKIDFDDKWRNLGKLSRIARIIKFNIKAIDIKLTNLFKINKY